MAVMPRRPEPGPVSWVTGLAWYLGYDLWALATGNETASIAFRRAHHRRPWMVRAVVCWLLLHLFLEEGIAAWLKAKAAR